jgi:hypothetical protein
VTVALILLLAAPPPVPVDRIDYRLPAQEQSPGLVGACRGGGDAEIVVCGRRGDRYRLEELKPPPGAEPRESGVVGVDLPFGRVEPLMETIVRSDGWVDKRVMVTLKMPF